jgi:beta-glucosidase
MSQEYKEAGNYGWYGPAMNIHRTAFAGRNFEYFSEDSILSAYLAAEEINGAAENGLYPYVKHFALNDQETNRCSFLMTYASEQAIREIYLKPFEEAIKNYEGTSLAVMSAFNWIGTEPCCGNDNLLKSVLRDEWGFTGLVETDYDGSYGYMITENCIHSGNDLMLGFGTADTNKVDTESASNVVALRQASKDIIYTIANSGYYADGDPTGGISNMTKIFVTVDVIIAVLIIAAETVLILRYRKKKQA